MTNDVMSDRESGIYASFDQISFLLEDEQEFLKNF